MLEPITILQNEDEQIVLYPNWLCDSEAGSLFSSLQNSIVWKTRAIKLFGKTHLIPRSESWVGSEGISYQYSGATYRSEGWPPFLLPYLDLIKKTTNWIPNGALLNRYEGGNQSMGWHSDNEPELGKNPQLVILSLGGSRDIHFRRTKTHDEKLKIKLENGSLLVMTGKVQNNWQHSIPKRKGTDCRISCTFREIEV